MVAAVVGRENAEQKLSAHTGIGRVAGRPFQIGGVLAMVHLIFYGYGFCLGGSSRSA